MPTALVIDALRLLEHNRRRSASKILLLILFFFIQINIYFTERVSCQSHADTCTQLNEQLKDNKSQLDKMQCLVWTDVMNMNIISQIK